MSRERLGSGRHTTSELAVDHAAGKGGGVAARCEDLMVGLISTGWTAVSMILLVSYRMLRLTL
jgi:hypothetical protein